MSFEFFISSRYLTFNNKYSFTNTINALSMIGICITVFVLLVTIGIISGFEFELKNKLLGVDPHIIIFNHGDCIEKERLIDQIIKNKDVTSSELVLYSQVFLKGERGLFRGFLKGINFYDDFPYLKLLKNNESDIFKCENKVIIEEGNKNYPIILGALLAENLGVVTGETVYLLPSISSDSYPVFIPFEVVGLITTGIHQYDESLVYVNIEDAYVVLEHEGMLQCIEVNLSNISKVQEIAKKLRNEIGPMFLVRDWTQLNSNFFLAFKIQKVSVSIILLIMNIIAVLGVSNSLIIMVLEKIPDIAILKIMGIEDFRVRRIFVIKGIFMGFIATLLGFILGLFMCLILESYQFIKIPEDIYFISTLPINFNFLEVIIICLGTILNCFLSTFFSSKKVLSLNPIDWISIK